MTAGLISCLNGAYRGITTAPDRNEVHMHKCHLEMLNTFRVSCSPDQVWTTVLHTQRMLQ